MRVHKYIPLSLLVAVWSYNTVKPTCMYINYVHTCIICSVESMLLRQVNILVCSYLVAEYSTEVRAALEKCLPELKMAAIKTQYLMLRLIVTVCVPEM